MSLSRRLAVVLVALTVAGCGFQPLYATQQQAGGSAQNAFEIFRGVNINRIDDRDGQFLRNRLTRLIHPSGQGRVTTHTLSVTLSESTTSLAVARSAVASRANLRITANFSLKPANELEDVYDGRVTATSGYNIFNSEFQTLSAEKGARERAFSDIAEQIRLRLAAHMTATDQTSNVGQ